MRWWKSVSVNAKVLHKQRVIQQYFSCLKLHKLVRRACECKGAFVGVNSSRTRPCRAAVPGEEEGWSPDIVPHSWRLGFRSQDLRSWPLETWETRSSPDRWPPRTAPIASTNGRRRSAWGPCALVPRVFGACREMAALSDASFQGAPTA